MKFKLAITILSALAVCSLIFTGILYSDYKKTEELLNKMQINADEMQRNVTEYTEKIAELEEKKQALEKEYKELSDKKAEEEQSFKAEAENQIKENAERAKEIADSAVGDTNAELIDGKYVKIETYDDGLTMGQKEDGTWEIISDPVAGRTITTDSSGNEVGLEDADGDGYLDGTDLYVGKKGEELRSRKMTPEEVAEIEADAKEMKDLGGIHFD